MGWMEGGLVESSEVITAAGSCIVVSGLPPPPLDVTKLRPAERAELIDKRLEGVNKFPALPDTQRQVADLAANMTFPSPLREQHHPLTCVAARIRAGIEERRPLPPMDTFDEVMADEIGDAAKMILEGLDMSESLRQLVSCRTLLKPGYMIGPRIGVATRAFLQMTKVSRV